MIYSAGDSGVAIDLGVNEPGAVLQRQGPSEWVDYLIAGGQVRGPVDVKTLVNALPTGGYRLVSEFKLAGSHF